ncbi:MAG: OmpH family outer membrane protein [Cytophagaceae bacterium]
MKNLSLILNVVLIIAVGILYFLFFKSGGMNNSGGEIAGDSVKNISVPVLPKGNDKIVYVDMDSLQNKYEYIKQLYKSLENKRFSDQAKLEGKARQFQDEYIKFQQDAQNGLLSEEQGMKMQAELAQKNKDLEELQGRYDQEYADMAKNAQNDYLKKLNVFLKKKSDEHNYAFVLGYTRGGQVIFAKDSLDITRVVIEGLNQEYKAKPAK